MSVSVITGGAGFIGTNLADRLLSAGQRVRVLDDLSRAGVEGNLSWLEERHGDRLEVEVADVREADSVAQALRGAGSVFHLAAQVAVTTSLDDPVRDAEVNLRGTINVLEAARSLARPPRVLFTSTNKVYGDLGDLALRDTGERYEPVDDGVRSHGVGEGRPLAFCTPYGCSKGGADQYVLDYAKSYGLPTAVFRMSCIYGPHQCGNEDQGWVAHFAIAAARGEPITIYGDGRQVRDILFVEDLVDAMLIARDEMDSLAGEAFNIGGGPANAVSLRDVLGIVARERGEDLDLRFGPWRTGDQRYYVTDIGAFSRRTGWNPAVSPPEGVRRLMQWLERDGVPAAAGAVAR